MRVLLAGTGIEPIPPDGYGGVERSLAEYAEALRRAGHEAIVVNQVRRRRSIDEYWFARELPHLLAGESFDALHASTPVVANRLAMVRRPYIFTSHSRHWFERRGLSQRWGFFLERRAVQRSAATVALSGRLKAAMTAALGRHLPRVEEIPIGVDTERFIPDWPARDGHRAIGVGIVDPMKRWEVAAEALRGLPFRLSIVGPVRDPAYAERLRHAGDGVEVVGEVSEPELVRRLSVSDLMVHPSRVELLPGAVLQGLASGLPVVGAEPIAGVVENGVTGFVATSPDVPSLLGSLRPALQSLTDPGRRRAMGEAAREDATRRFAWGEVVRRHLALYAAVPTGSGR